MYINIIPSDFIASRIFEYSRASLTLPQGIRARFIRQSPLYLRCRGYERRGDTGGAPRLPTPASHGRATPEHVEADARVAGIIAGRDERRYDAAERCDAVGRGQ